MLTIAGRTFRSRLFLGTGKYPDFPAMAAALEISGTEVVTVARIDDHLAGERVHRRPARDLGVLVDDVLERLDHGPLSACDELVDLKVARRGFAHEQGPGHVAAIAVDLRSEVEEQDRGRSDRSIARGAMW